MAKVKVGDRSWSPKLKVTVPSLDGALEEYVKYLHSHPGLARRAIRHLKQSPELWQTLRRLCEVEGGAR